MLPRVDRQGSSVQLLNARYIFGIARNVGNDVTLEKLFSATGAEGAQPIPFPS